ncbi:MAG TPA: hypothetical protein VJQ56_14495 [Blastocatellia bacterium]|nr:hypothetical protein [Blastocatellia bacterium]
MKRRLFLIALSVVQAFFASAFAPRAAAQQCNAPALICKAASNQDHSLYVRDHCRYAQKLRIERFKIKNGKESMEEERETSVMVEPERKPDKTGMTPVVVRVTSDTDKRGNPKSSVNEGERTLLSVGAIWDLAFFPLLPEKIKFYNFQEVVSERKNEKWFRFVPKAEETQTPLASGVVQLDPETGEVLTIKIESLHNLEAIDKEASKLRSFNAVIDYSQFQGSLRMPTLASGSGVSQIRRFEGTFRFRFEEGRYAPVFKLE